MVKPAISAHLRAAAIELDAGACANAPVATNAVARNRLAAIILIKAPKDLGRH